MPDSLIGATVLIGEGTDNIAYEVNGDLIVRFSKEPDSKRRAELITGETALLAEVARFSPLPVPVPLSASPDRGCWSYRKIPGEPLLTQPQPRRAGWIPAIAADLGAFLAALHAAPAGQMARYVDPDETPLTEWQDEAAGNYDEVVDHVPAAYRIAVEAFLSAPPPPQADSPVFSHNDLGIEHILVNPATGTITGIIDWTDAALTDPAYDFGLLHRDLGPAALDLALGAYQPAHPAILRERAVFYARCSVFEDLAYGLDVDRDEYTSKSLRALAWLFAE